MDEGTPFPDPIIEFSLKQKLRDTLVLPEEYIILFRLSVAQAVFSTIIVALALRCRTNYLIRADGRPRLSQATWTSRSKWPIWDGCITSAFVADEISPTVCVDYTLISLFITTLSIKLYNYLFHYYIFISHFIPLILPFLSTYHVHPFTH